MPFSTTGKNIMLDALTIDLVSLHSGHPGALGTSNELSGGSPPYARQPVTVGAAAAGSRDTTSQPVLNVPAGSEVAVIGLWTNAGSVFLGWAPNGASGNTPQAGYANAADNTINSAAHGLSNGNRVFIMSLADNLPSPLSESTLYYVVSATDDSFQVSLTQGGAAISIATDGDLIFQRCIVESFAQQGTFTVQDADIGL